MSPKNHLLTRAQITVWYIPSVPGADTRMCFNILLYFIHWLQLYIHVFVTLLVPNVGLW